MPTSQVSAWWDGHSPSRPQLTMRAPLLAGFYAVCGYAAVIALSIPSEPGMVVLRGAMGVGTLVSAAVPFLLRARPRPFWMLWSVGWLLTGVAFPLSVMFDTLNKTHSDAVISMVGYVCLGIWVLVLTHRMAGPRALLWSVLDTAAVTVGVVLLLWGLAPTAELASWVVYPLVDLATLGFAGQLLLRVRRLTFVMRWFLPTIAFALLTDVTIMLSNLTHLTVPTTWTLVVLLVVNCVLLGGITHPAFLALTEHPPAPLQVDCTWLRNAYLELAVGAGTAGLLVPLARDESPIIRPALLVVLMVLLVSRLLVTTNLLAQSEARSRHRASHDELTGLMNRTALFEHLGVRLQRNRSEGRATALLFVDCDAFKDVNDRWGPLTGDAVLRKVAAGLAECVGENDLLARHGGDGFVIVSDVTAAEQARWLAHRVQERLGRPLAVSPGHGQVLTQSIGIALAEPTELLNGADLLGRAAIALHSAKEVGRGRCVVFHPPLQSRAVERAVLSEELRRAIVREELFVVYQPIRTGGGYQDLAGWEALARWEHAERGNISPAEFIPLAESVGLISRLGDLVLRRACREFAWMSKYLGRTDVTLSVNVSAAQLLADHFPERVLGVLKGSGLEPSQLILEITESRLVAEATPALDTLFRLRQAGVSISLDDFGTGYASITTLLRLPVDGVKIDGSLVAGLGHDPGRVDQVRAVLQLVRSKGIERITAERIETPEQAVALAVLGCPSVQGYLFGKPERAERFLGHRPLGEERAAVASVDVSRSQSMLTDMLPADLLPTDLLPTDRVPVDLRLTDTARTYSGPEGKNRAGPPRGR